MYIYIIYTLYIYIIHIYIYNVYIYIYVEYLTPYWGKNHVESFDSQEIQASALVQGLIRRDGHPNLIAHAQQQQAALGAIDGDLLQISMYMWENCEESEQGLYIVPNNHSI